jgi:endonuclease/exonuclease/phosphatase family metal-dependent hydrolase
VRLSHVVAAAAMLATAGCAHTPPVAADSTAVHDLSCRREQLPESPRPIWIAPADAEDRSRLAKWCETVGPVLFQPQPAADIGPIEALAIVSWNIHEGGGDVEELIRRLRDGEFTGGESIGHVVLLLQEATRRDEAVPLRISRGAPAPRRIGATTRSTDRDIRRLAETGLAVLYAPSMRNGDRAGVAEDRGNAIVSTLPMTLPRVIELPLERQRRVVVAARVEGTSARGSSWQLDVVDVHLDTALALLHGGPLEARRRQTVALLDALRMSSPGAARTTVVAGDFNAWAGDREPAVGLLRGEFSDPVEQSREATWAGPLGLRARLDRMFMRGAPRPILVSRLPSRFGSDHYPLLAVFRF